MKKTDPDKTVAGNDDSSQAGLTGLLEKKTVTGQPEESRGNFRHVAGAVYECLVTPKSCRFKFHFGTANFCSWLLNKHGELPDNKPPCSKTDKDEDEKAD